MVTGVRVLSCDGWVESDEVLRRVGRLTTRIK